MKAIKVIILFSLISLLSPNVFSQGSSSDIVDHSETMKTYVIERDIPEAGNFTPDELKGISQKSCGVLDQMGSENIQWLHSYVTEDKIYCVYKAQNKELLKEHAAKGGFPANSISEVSTMIGPETAK
jgi:hypothetical protein